jgi:hypothetical protein
MSVTKFVSVVVTFAFPNDIPLEDKAGSSETTRRSVSKNVSIAHGLKLLDQLINPKKNLLLIQWNLGSQTPLITNKFSDKKKRLG